MKNLTLQNRKLSLNHDELKNFFKNKVNTHNKKKYKKN